jgi:hypothetical protein
MTQASIFKGSLGLNNALEPHRLRYTENGFCEFAEGVNIVIDDGGSFARRKGIAEVFEGPSHSLWSRGDFCFFISEGDLYRRMLDDTNVLVLGAVGDIPMYFEVMHGKCYASNGSVRLVITDSSVSSWDYRPIVQEKGDTRVFGMPESFTKLLVHAGRMFVVDGDYLWESLPGDPHRFELSSGPVSIPGLSDFISVKTGIYASCDEGVVFLQGAAKADMQKSTVYGSPVISGTMQHIDGADVDAGVEYFGRCAIWVSQDGVCIGDQRGVVHNKTSRKLVFDKATSGAAVVLPGQYFFSLEVE